jgi:pimeloyl-ACP methyl ester carboxylesterase
MSTQETDTFSVQHSIDNGIERISYIPRHRRFDTPILMQHGMWHGAKCWQTWQELFAEWGWESHAISLPGHGSSPAQRPVKLCTLDYYLKYLQAEVSRLPCKPILMGHSMGGALTQRYLKYVGDDLPAAVLVAPWDSHSTMLGYGRWLKLVFPGILLAALTLSATPFIRTPKRAAEKLISAKSVCTPEELLAQLGPESVWVMMQHNPPFWFPPRKVKTPLLWLAGEKDAVVGVKDERRSAAHYQADFVIVHQSAHNIMMEYNFRETAELIHNWLSTRGIQ